MFGERKEQQSKTSPNFDYFLVKISGEADLSLYVVDLIVVLSNPAMRRHYDELDSSRHSRGPRRAIVETPRQQQRRLPSDEAAELVEAYRAGATVYELAERFGVDRRTASVLLERTGVARRYRLLSRAQLEEAAQLHDEGWSFERLGQRYGVSGSTVWNGVRRQ